MRGVRRVEIYAFGDRLDANYILVFDFETILGRRSRLCMLAESWALFHTIMKIFLITENKLMIDVQDFQEAYQNLEISNDGHVFGCDSLADWRTQLNDFPQLIELLKSVIISAFLEIKTVFSNNRFAPALLWHSSCLSYGDWLLVSTLS